MKVVFLAVIFLTTTVWADSCLERSIDPNWPANKFELVLSCNLSKNNLGAAYGDKICFSIYKAQYSDYKNTTFKTIRFEEGGYGNEVSIVTRLADGGTPKGNEISVNGSTYSYSVFNESFEFNQKWIETTVVDVKNPSSLVFNVYDKKLLGKTLKASQTYNCKTEI